MTSKEKCSTRKHVADWEDNEISELTENEIRVECNCECLTECYMRIYHIDGEYKLKGDEYIPV